MRWPVLLLVSLVVGGLLSAACGGCRPSGSGAPSEPVSTPALESLRSPVYSPEHGLEDWTRRLERRGSDPAAAAEWQRALAFCRERDPERHPNCRTVLLLESLSRVPGFVEGTREVSP
jgi:hypothetical protein